MENEFKIEKGVPIPPRKIQSKYPWDQMDIGDSFFVPSTSGYKLSKIQSNAYAYGIKITPKRKFVIRTLEKGFRIWRVV